MEFIVDLIVTRWLNRPAVHCHAPRTVGRSRGQPMTGTPQVDTALSSRFPASFDREYRMIIDGRPVSGSDESAFRCVDPYEDAEWGVIYAADGPVVDTAVAAARRAFDEGPWGRSSAAERARLLRSLADVVDRNA